MKFACLPLLLGLVVTATASAQSTEASQASALSLAPSMELAAMTLRAIPAGSGLVIRALKPMGQTVELLVLASATGASFVVEVGSETVHALGLAVGTALSVTAISAGYLIYAGSEALAFIPDELARSLVHHRELSQ